LRQWQLLAHCLPLLLPRAKAKPIRRMSCWFMAEAAEVVVGMAVAGEAMVGEDLVAEVEALMALAAGTPTHSAQMVV
jgi:hypothetical protein